MLHLLSTETTTIILILFKTPLRKLVIIGIDEIKHGRGGSIAVKTLFTAVFILLLASLYSIFRFTLRRSGDLDDADLDLTQQVFFVHHLLESSLIGFILFLALMIDRLHRYIRELRLRRKTVKAIEKTNQLLAKQAQANAFKDTIKQLELQLQNRIKEASSSEATAQALKKQTEGLHYEYDRLLAENKTLRYQLKTLDRTASLSAVKKDS